jgi:hypothetical protein
MGIAVDLPVVETTVIADVFVSGIARVEQLGNGVLRFVLYCDQIGPAGHERAIVARLLWSAADLPEAVKRTAAAAAVHGIMCSCLQGSTCH